jgi:hypothetical protein
MPKKTKKLYTADDGSDFIHVEFTDARWPVDFTLKLDDHFVGTGRKGRPWECLLVVGAQLAAAGDPNLFQHPVLYGYAEGSDLYIMTAKSRRARELHQCVRYHHNFTKRLRAFDTFSKAKFLQQFGADGVEIKLTPPRQRRPGRVADRVPVAQGPRVRRKRTYRGARRRAIDAGLVVPV